jgi:hypothetical protein
LHQNGYYHWSMYLQVLMCSHCVSTRSLGQEWIWRGTRRVTRTYWLIACLLFDGAQYRTWAESDFWLMPKSSLPHLKQNNPTFFGWQVDWFSFDIISICLYKYYANMFGDLISNV